MIAYTLCGIRFLDEKGLLQKIDPRGQFVCIVIHLGYCGSKLEVLFFSTF